MRIVANEAQAQQAEAAMGHNRPPEAIDPLTERLREDYGALLDAADTLAAQLANLPARITTEEQRHRASEFAVMKLAATAKSLEDAHAEEKEPFLVAARTCDRLLLQPAKLLREGKRQVERLIGAYLAEVEERKRQAAEEEARRAAEEAERLRLEAEAAIAQAQTEEALTAAVAAEDKAADAYLEADKAAQVAESKPADLTRSHSSSGVLSSLRKEWRSDGFDRATLDLEPLRPYLPQDAIEKAIKAFIRAGGRSLRGAAIREVAKATVR